ncbi:MAG: diphthine--ammonia ligase [Thermoplasmatota archaeon]
MDAAPRRGAPPNEVPAAGDWVRVALLASGGKDSVLAGHVLESWGWEVACLVCLEPALSDSWMFHVPNLSVVPGQAAAWGKPLVRIPVSGRPEEEVDELERGLRALPFSIDAIASGAIASEYQRTRIDRIGHRLGLKSFAPLWHKEGAAILDTLEAGRFEVRFSSVAAEGFDASWLGRSLNRDARADLERLRAERGIHVAGEGGEYESLVLSAPGWKRRIAVQEASVRWERDRGFWTVDRWALAA